MRPLSFLLLLGSVPFLCQAQVHEYRGDLDNSEIIQEDFYLPGKGLFVKTGWENMHGGKKGWNLHHFDMNGALVWTFPLEREHKVKLMTNKLFGRVFPKTEEQEARGPIDFWVGSVFSDYTYHIETAQTEKEVRERGGKKYVIHQITDQVNKTLRIEDIENTLDWFVSKSSLHGIYNNLSAKDPKIILYSWDHHSLDITEQELFLPGEEKNLEFSRWWFAGHQEGMIFLARRNAFDGDSIITGQAPQVEIAVFDLEGNLKRVMDLDMTLEPGAYAIRSKDHSSRFGLVQGIKSSVEIMKLGSRTMESGGSYTTVDKSELFTPLANAHIFIDPTGHLYIYGQYGNKEIHEKKFRIKGIYLLQFDATGNRLNSILQPINMEIISNKESWEWWPEDRGMHFLIVPGKGYVLQYIGPQDVYSIDLDLDLELLKECGETGIVRHGYGAIEMDYLPSIFSPQMNRYVAGRKSKAKKMTRHSYTTRHYLEGGQVLFLTEDKNDLLLAHSKEE